MTKKVCRFKRVLGMKDAGGVYERGGGGWYPNAHYENVKEVGYYYYF